MQLLSFSLQLFEELILAILGIVWITIAFILPFKGLSYDNARKRIDRKYKDEHFFYVKNLRVRLPIPVPILFNTNDLIVEKSKKQYNIYVYLFWVLVFLMSLSQS